MDSLLHFAVAGSPSIAIDLPLRGECARPLFDIAPTAIFESCVHRKDKLAACDRETHGHAAWNHTLAAFDFGAVNMSASGAGGAKTQLHFSNPTAVPTYLRVVIGSVDDVVTMIPGRDKLHVATSHTLVSHAATCFTLPPDIIANGIVIPPLSRITVPLFATLQNIVSSNLRTGAGTTAAVPNAEAARTGTMFSNTIIVGVVDASSLVQQSHEYPIRITGCQPMLSVTGPWSQSQSAVAQIFSSSSVDATTCLHGEGVALPVARKQVAARTIMMPAKVAANAIPLAAHSVVTDVVHDVEMPVPPAINFNPQYVGTTSSASTLRLRNDGLRALIFRARICLSEEDTATSAGGSFTLHASKGVIAPEMSFSLNVAFNAKAPGSVAAGILIEFTDYDDATAFSSTKICEKAGISSIDSHIDRELENVLLAPMIALVGIAYGVGVSINEIGSFDSHDITQTQANVRVDFGHIRVRIPSDVTFRVVNKGPGSIRLALKRTQAGTFIGDMLRLSLLNTTLAPSDATTLTIRFQAFAPTSHVAVPIATLMVEDAKSARIAARVPILLSANATDVRLIIEPVGGLRWGSQDPGSSVDRVLILRNRELLLHSS